jgi:cytidylate kinase
MSTHGRSIERLVEEQCRRGQLFVTRAREEPSRQRLITISRQHGAGGGELARRLAQLLGFGFYDREILREIAASAHLSERVVESLDDKRRELVTDWLASVVMHDYLSPVEYHERLLQVIGTLVVQGGAVIVGRGAHLILRHGEALRVFVVAPLADRVRTVVRRERLTERGARQRIAEVEHDRAEFLRRHFHAGFGDPAMFDLVVNTSQLGFEGCVAAVRAAFQALSSPVPTLQL